MLKVIVFDLDGTLVDSIEDIVDSLNGAMSFYNLPTHTKDEYIVHFGKGAKNLVDKSMGNLYNESLANDVYNKYISLYEENRCNKTKPYEGVVEGLKVLKEKYKLAVISNKPDSDTVPMVEHFFPGVFDYVVGKKDTVLAKPNVDSMELLYKYFNVFNKEVVYVGDSYVDHDFAFNCGVECFLFTYGIDNKERFDKSVNCTKLNKFEELVKKL